MKDYKFIFEHSFSGWQHETEIRDVKFLDAGICLALRAFPCHVTETSLREDSNTSCVVT